MDFTRRLLELHISQAGNALQKAKSYSYSDKHKEVYQDKLDQLFQSIKLDIEKTNPTTDLEVFNYKKHLDFIFRSLEFLGSSTLNLIPYEIVECLNFAMGDWIDTSDKYIIVTSLINNNGEFSFDPFLAFFDQLYDDIKLHYNIEFEKRLIQINLPRSLSRDYLSAVVLYHELGHFIDIKLSIIESLIYDLQNRFANHAISDDDKTKIRIFIPFIDKISDTGAINAINMHFSEYFCDLFASQYIGESSNHFLSYVTEKSSNWDETHPATKNRIKVVSDFLNNVPNIIVALINSAVEKITTKRLEKRFEEIQSNDFYNLLPVNIQNVEQLHGIFDYSWRMWLDEQNLLKNLELQKPISTEKVYSIINNLTEKTIGNFITISKWKKVHP